MPEKTPLFKWGNVCPGPLDTYFLTGQFWLSADDNKEWAILPKHRPPLKPHRLCLGSTPKMLLKRKKE